MVKVVVAVDNSSSAERAFKRAVEVMGGRGSLVVLHVTEVVTTSVLDPFHDTLDHLQNVEARETATHVRKKFEGLCHSASPKVAQWEYREVEASSPKEALLRQTEELEGADLLVVGRKGMSTLDKLLLGSTSEYVVAHAHMPVMVVH
ncbi:universal stress domain containing protein [Acanthamoeba castellanii str. Neff]|uniref:Universal stress domain containing protein n=1 Tax=Acanthamoeba castellanii (strain ATCC 30010 / Neff) TaxID=1257118 RepID=L8HB68_ACACF|nr:universal stress domain containing protein [Acanthamoeba castellanii str. Neff]ELR21978.1 universal stress domain containing protein [Acanthamoeba castellanii str. Neff]